MNGAYYVHSADKHQSLTALLDLCLERWAMRSANPPANLIVPDACDAPALYRDIPICPAGTVGLRLQPGQVAAGPTT